MYYAEVAARTDASSRFGADHRWGMFWSLGFMWNIKNEAFLKDIEWLTSAQVKLSTGTSGNSEIPYYVILRLFPEMQTIMMKLVSILHKVEMRN